MVVELLKQGEDAGIDGEQSLLAQVDSYKNTLLHLCVVHELTDMYDFLLSTESTEDNNLLHRVFESKDQHENKDQQEIRRNELKEQQQAMKGCTNTNGLTPFTLAAKIGSKKMLAHIMQKDRKIMWMYVESRFMLNHDYC
jgi:hypothetical protein